MRFPEFDISGRKAVLIGAARGIGRGVADVLAEAGAELAIASMNPASAEQAAAAIRAAGGKARSFAVDATRAPDMERFAGEVLGALGGVDILVNCVGDHIGKPVVARPGREEAGMSESEWHHIVDLNLTQAFTACRAFGPQLLKQKRGTVINLSGVAALRARPERSAYGAAKAALVAFTESTALEWAPYGVRVNSIAPGLFPDPAQISAADLAARQARARNDIPLQRVGRLREVGFLSLYLASDAADFVTGQTFCIDGGASIA